MTVVYIPATLPMLAQLVADGSLRPVNGTAFALTPRLREAYAEGDDDELADVALREAALASLRLLAAQETEAAEGAGASSGSPPPRRAVRMAVRSHAEAEADDFDEGDHERDEPAEQEQAPVAAWPQLPAQAALPWQSVAREAQACGFVQGRRPAIRARQHRRRR